MMLKRSFGVIPPARWAKWLIPRARRGSDVPHIQPKYAHSQLVWRDGTTSFRQRLALDVGGCMRWND